MSIVELKDAATGASAKILTSLGLNCFEFRVPIDGHLIDVLDAVPDFATGAAKPSGSGIPILFPFPNRIRNGQFRWQDRLFQLPQNNKTNAIHGLCYDRPWRVIERRVDFVTGQFQLSVDAPDRLSLWPTDFILEVDYELLAGRLRANFRIQNPGRDVLPWGLGTHPYFKIPFVPGSTARDCLLDAPVSGRWELAESLPTGKIQELTEDDDLRDGAIVADLQLDDVFTGIACPGPQFDVLLIDERAGIQVVQTCPPIFRELVVFTPPGRQAICLEPYTCPTDAIHLAAQGLDVGWRTLNPGSEFHTWIDLLVTNVMS